ncbi:MAG: tRNA pseudouridine13 synthase [Saprospiraceae bacterium]|jgi:tRNA pseudouridine13 synthase
MHVINFNQFVSLHKPQVTGEIRQAIEDFKVVENLGFTPSGEGSHLWLYIEKQDLNTVNVAQQLAQYFSVRIADIGYSGLKDKRAITQQWFSVPGSAETTDLASLDNQKLRVLKSLKHHSKLKRGTHKSNSFELVIRKILGETATLNQVLDQIALSGVPNYFGPQRFGNNSHNVEQALKLFAGQIKPDRTARSMYLSAARSYLYNLILAQRIAQGTWDTALVGDAMSLAGSNSYFLCEEIDSEIIRRLAEQDIHPSGAMWGKGELVTTGAVASLEQSVIDQNVLLADGLCKQGLKQSRRALRLIAQDLAYHWEGNSTLTLNFTLPKGAFATSLLREVVKLEP